MREVVLVMPDETEKQRGACGLALQDLDAMFGAYQRQDAHGLWKGVAEHCQRVIIAMNPLNQADAVRVLLEYGRSAGEQAIYYVDAWGEAHVIDMETEEEIVEKEAYENATR